jgi:hypothetical protein
MQKQPITFVTSGFEKVLHGESTLKFTDEIEFWFLNFEKFVQQEFLNLKSKKHW